MVGGSCYLKLLSDSLFIEPPKSHGLAAWLQQINHLVRGPSAVPHEIIKVGWRSRPPIRYRPQKLRVLVDEIEYTNIERLWPHVKLYSRIPTNHTYTRLPQFCVSVSESLLILIWKSFKCVFVIKILVSISTITRSVSISLCRPSGSQLKSRVRGLCVDVRLQQNDKELEQETGAVVSRVSARRTVTVLRILQVCTVTTTNHLHS